MALLDGYRKQTLTQKQADGNYIKLSRWTSGESVELESGLMLQEAIGAKNGIAELDSTGKIPSNQLPSFVDDVIEGYFNNNKFYKDSNCTIEILGESGKIYTDLENNKTYRWSGSYFVVISETLALGENSTTAYRGDRGKTAYDHSQKAHAPSNAEVNQNAFSNVKIGTTTIAADSKTDTLEIVAGTNVTITTDETNDTITISAKDTNTTYSDATQSTHGLMTAADKKKLDGIAEGATAGSYKHPDTHPASMITGLPTSLPANGGNAATVGGFTVGCNVPANAKFTDNNTWIALKGATTSAAGTAGYAPAPSAGAANRYLRSDGTWQVPPDNNTTYGVVSTTANGLAPKRDGSTSTFLRGDGTWAVPSGNEIYSSTEPTNQPVGGYWIKEY